MPKPSKPASEPDTAAEITKNHGTSAPGRWTQDWDYNDPISLQPGEPYVAHSAMLDYVELWPHGTLRQLSDKYIKDAEEAGGSPKSTMRSMTQFCHKYRWRDRIARYEEIRFAALEAARLQELARVRGQREKVADGLLDAGGKLLEWLNKALEMAVQFPGTMKIKPSEVASVAKTAIEMSVLVHGGGDEVAGKKSIDDETALVMVEALRASFARREDDTVEGEFREVKQLTTGGTNNGTADTNGTAVDGASSPKDRRRRRGDGGGISGAGGDTGDGGED